MILDFDTWWYLVLGLMIVLTVLNAVFLYQVYVRQPDLLERMGNPSFMYFATGGWLTARGFTSFLLSSAGRNAFRDKPVLLVLSQIVAVLYILLLLGVFFALLDLFLSRANAT